MEVRRLHLHKAARDDDWATEHTESNTEQIARMRWEQTVGIPLTAGLVQAGSILGSTITITGGNQYVGVGVFTEEVQKFWR